MVCETGMRGICILPSGGFLMFMVNTFFVFLEYLVLLRVHISWGSLTWSAVLGTSVPDFC